MVRPLGRSPASKPETIQSADDANFHPDPVKYPAAATADAVGAGDACSAGILAGWLMGWAPARSAELANRLGAYVASRPGATPELPPELVELVHRN